MPSGQPITEDEFWLIKKKLSDPDADAYLVGYQVGRGVAKISIIGACKDYEEYQRISKAEHPPVKNSLADRVSELERRVDVLEGLTEPEQRKRTELALEVNGE